MTVEQLIYELRQYPKDIEVLTDMTSDSGYIDFIVTKSESTDRKKLILR